MADTGNQNQVGNAPQVPPANNPPINAENLNIGDIQHRGPIHHLTVQGNLYHHGNEPRPEVAHDSAAPSSNSAASWQETTLEAAVKVIGTLPRNQVPLDIIRDFQAALEEFGSVGLTRLRVNEANFTMLELNQLFAAAKEEAIEEAQSKEFYNKAAHDDYVERHGNVVGMTGIAGIGKTTAILQTLMEVADGLPADEKGYLLFKYLKHLNLNQPIGVLQFLSSNPNWKHTNEIDDQILERLSKSKNLFIFLDGLDEPRFKDLHLDAPVMGLYDRATPMVILQNLLRGDILANAHKLLTSRPGAFLKLHPSCKPHFVVRVIGFNESSQDLYFRQICPEKEDYVKVTMSLGQNPAAKALCFLPIFAKTVAPYIIKHGTKDGTFTLTDVFAALVSDCIHSPKFKEHPRILRKLSDLALYGMLNDKITFEQTDFVKVDFDADGLEDFLNMKVFSSDQNLRILEGDRVFFFIHLLWQEFFTSLKLLFDTDLDAFSKLLQNMQSNTWEMVLRFIFGLLNTGLHHKLNPIFQISPIDVASKTSLLKGLIHLLGSKLLSNDGESFNSKLFKLCSLAQELNDEEITASVADSLPEELHMKGGTLLPSEVSYLCHVLRAADRELVISTSAVTFTGNGLEMLMGTIAKTYHKMDEACLKTSGSRDFTALSTCVHKMNRLGLDITGDLSGFEVLTEAIARRETPMEKFRVDRLGPREVGCLAACAHNINQLVLRFCNTTGSNLEPLTDAISQMDRPMEVLLLYGHKLGSRELSCLATSVHNIKQLELRNCKIAGSDLQPLTDAISRIDRPMKKLILSHNKLGLGGLSCLATSLGNLNQLELVNCEISGSDLRPITDAISRMERPMGKLELRGNNELGSQGLAFLRTCVHNVQELELNNCGIGEADVDSLRKELFIPEKAMQRGRLRCIRTIFTAFQYLQSAYSCSFYI